MTLAYGNGDDDDYGDGHDRRQVARRGDDTKAIVSRALWGLLAVLWAILFAIVGWNVTNGATEFGRMRDELNATKTEMALTKRDYANLLAQLDRIEKKVDSVAELQRIQERRR